MVVDHRREAPQEARAVARGDVPPGLERRATRAIAASVSSEGGDATEATLSSVTGLMTSWMVLVILLLTSARTRGTAPSR